MSELTDWERQQIEMERHKLRRRGREYFAPLFRRLAADVEGRPKVLSVGCGIAEDLEALADAGLEVYGVDPGFRMAEWGQRGILGRLLRADGRRLPFADGTFDIVMSSGVIEHVGAAGDGLELLPDFREHRARYAREMVRVTRPGGSIVLDTPNVRFPIDAWHGPYHLWGRWHSPWERFLVSFKQIRDLFVGQGGARTVEALGLRGFFVFDNVRQRPLGRLAGLMAGGLIRLADVRLFRWVRRSWLMPYLVVRIVR